MSPSATQRLAPKHSVADWPIYISQFFKPIYLSIHCVTIHNPYVLFARRAAPQHSGVFQKFKFYAFSNSLILAEYWISWGNVHYSTFKSFLYCVAQYYQLIFKKIASLSLHRKNVFNKWQNFKEGEMMVLRWTHCALMQNVIFSPILCNWERFL